MAFKTCRPHAVKRFGMEFKKRNVFFKTDFSAWHTLLNIFSGLNIRLYSHGLKFQIKEIDSLNDITYVAKTKMLIGSAVNTQLKCTFGVALMLVYAKAGILIAQLNFGLGVHTKIFLKPPYNKENAL